MRARAYAHRVQEYDELVQDFESFVDAVQRVFASDAAALNARHTTAPSATVSNLYADFALDSSCQFLDLLDALGAFTASDVSV